MQPASSDFPGAPQGATTTSVSRFLLSTSHDLSSTRQLSILSSSSGRRLISRQHIIIPTTFISFPVHRDRTSSRLFYFQLSSNTDLSRFGARRFSAERLGLSLPFIVSALPLRATFEIYKALIISVLQLQMHMLFKV